MADNASLAAALMGLQRRRDPLEIYQSFGRGLRQQGTSTAPLGSGNPLEGIARALQGGLGGLVEGYGIRKQEEQGQNNIDALAGMLGAKTPDEMATLAKGFKGDSDVVAPILAQLVAQRQKSFQDAAKSDQFGAAYGAPSSPAQPAPTMAGTLPPGPSAGGAFANNSGNIRATALPWEGKGAPQNGFETFGTPQAGANAQFKNFAAYVQANPNITVAQALTKWAPPNENDTGNYIRTIAEASGVNPGMPLADVLKDPGIAAALMDAQARLEKGGMPQGFTADTFMTAAGARGVSGPSTTPPSQLAQGDAAASGGDGTPLATPSTTSGPPDLPRPAPTADQIAKYKGLIASGQMTGAQAVEALDREVTQQWQMDKTRGLEVWKDQQASKRQNEKAAIDLGQRAPMEMINKRVDAYEKDIRPRADNAVSEITAIHQARQLLDAGAFTGTGANAQAASSRLAQAFGLDWGADKQANTAALQSAMGARVLALVKNLGAGSGISNADREYAERVAGGDIAAGEPAIRKVLEIGERSARAILKSHDVEADRIKKLPGMAQLGDEQFSVRAAPAYEEWAKANPLVQQAAPAAPAAPATPSGGPAGGDALAQAKDAIARGAPRDAVIKRLQSMGVTPEGL